LILAVDQLAFDRWRVTSAGAMSSADIALRVRRHREDLRTDLVVVDYLQLLGERAQTLREKVVAGSKGLAALALNENLVVLTASQFSRKPKDAANRRPTLADLKEAGDIEQDATVVLLVHHTDDWHGVIVAKQRDGGLSDVRLDWDKYHTRWGDYARPTVAPAPDEALRYVD